MATASTQAPRPYPPGFAFDVVMDKDGKPERPMSAEESRRIKDACLARTGGAAKKS
jgi:hypothetical protein